MRELLHKLPHFDMVNLRPTHSRRLLFKDANAFEEGDRFLQTLVDGHDAVLVLDGQYLVVAAETEVGDHVSPVGLAVAVAHGAEDPRAVQFVAVVLGIQNTVGGGVVLVDLGVLGVDVVNGTLQLANGRHGIHALPNEVRRIEVRTNHGTDSLAETKQSGGIVHAESGVHQVGS